MSYQVLARKYRPQKFSEVVGQDHITRTLQNAIAEGRLHHAYLFTGVRGVGKTTLARILSKALNCKDGPATEPCNKCPPCTEITNCTSMDVQEIDGASNTGVDDVREIRERVKYLPAGGRYKIYIIDEVHMLSTAAFNALLKTLEEPPPHVIFIFATTEPHKIPATILSRCQRYDFRRITASRIAETLKIIAKSEGVGADGECLHIIANEAEGSMRDAESLFDQAVAYAGKRLTYQHLKDLLGFMDREVINSAVKAIVEKDAKRILEISDELFQGGANLVRFATDLLQRFRHLLVLKTCPPSDDRVVPDLSAEDLGLLKELLPRVTLEECNQWFNILYRGAEEMTRTKFQKMVLDVLLIRMAQAGPVASIDELLQRVEQIQIHPPLNPLPSREGKTELPPAVDFPSWLKVNRPVEASILENALGYDVNGQRFSVKFPKGSLYGDMLTETERRSSFEKTISDFFKTKLSLSVEFTEEARPQDNPRGRIREEEEKRKVLQDEALSHEIVREAATLFGAEIKEIKTK